MYLEKWRSYLSYSTRFLNYEINHFKKYEFEKINLIIQEPSRKKSIDTTLFKSKDPLYQT